jgi:hypothetical protein
MPAVMMLSRGVRRVPMDYDPPLDPRGGYHPVFDQFYDDALAEWREEKRRWDAGERPDYFRPKEDGEYTFEEYHGEAPDPDYYYPGSAWPEDAEMAIRMYESVTEGTPISRPYPETPAGRRAMANELAAGDTSITSHFTVDDWLEVIDGQIMGTDIHTGEIVR